MNALLPPPDLKPHKVTVEELLGLEQRGAFAGLPRLELLEGVLYEMSPQKSPHVLAKNRLTFQLQSQILDLELPYQALCEPTVAIGQFSAPEPDVVIWDKSPGDGFFSAASILLAVEVSLTTLKTDLNYKKALYAKAGIPEYWVFDVDADRMHQFWKPVDGAYQESKVYATGEPVPAMTIAGIEVATDGLL